MENAEDTQICLASLLNILIVLRMKIIRIEVKRFKSDYVNFSFKKGGVAEGPTGLYFQIILIHHITGFRVQCTY